MGSPYRMTLPRVSIIIPVAPGGTVRALAGLAPVTYPQELFEVLVAYGRAPSVQRNRAANEAEGDILYFLDDDSRVAPGFLERAVPHYENPKVAAAGGPSLTPVTDSPLQRAIGVVLSSAVGGGGVRNRYRKAGEARHTGDSELILCNLSFRREIFLSHGGLDSRLYPNEENELMDRLVGEGFYLVHDPELGVQRSQRPTWKAYVKQMLGYGRGRGEQTRISGRIKPVAMAPSLFVVYLLLLPLLGSWILSLPFFAYLALMLAASLQGALGARDLTLLPRLLVLFPALHLLYGVGVVWGLVRPRFKGAPRSTDGIEIRRVKAFGEPLNAQGQD